MQTTFIDTAPGPAAPSANRSAAKIQMERGTAFLEQGGGEQADVLRQLVSEIHSLREDPKAYGAALVAALRPKYDGKRLTYPDGSTLETDGGVATLDELACELERLAALPSLTLSRELSTCCERHLLDLQVNDRRSHLGADQSTPEERVNRLGECHRHCGENIAFGLTGGQSILWHMLLDDGSADRGQRRSLLSPSFRHFGLAFGSHPTSTSCAVLVLVDRFVTKVFGAKERVAAVADGVPAAAGAEADMVSQWTAICDSVRPPHLSCNTKQLACANRMMRPPEQQPQNRVVTRRVVTKALHVKPHIDPAVVKAFVHRVDGNFDDLVEEVEVEAIAAQCNLAIGQEKISHMFNEILDRRPEQLRHMRAVSWDELYAAMRARKQWVTTVSIDVTADSGESWTLISVLEELHRFCLRISKDYKESGANFPALPPPPVGCGESQQRGLLRKIQAWMQKLCLGLHDHLLPVDDITIQGFFQKTSDDYGLTMKPRRFTEINVGRPEKSWSYPSRPYREVWVGIFKAFNMNPLVDLEPSPLELPVTAQFDMPVSSTAKRNVSQSATVKYTGLPPGVEGVTIRKKKEGVKVRSEQPRSLYPANEDVFATAADAIPQRIPAWEDKRSGSEFLVNQKIISKPRLGDDNAAPPDAGPGGAAGAAPDKFEAAGDSIHVSFDALRMFTSNLQKQERASSEQRFLSFSKSGGTLGQTTNPREQLQGTMATRHYNNRITDGITAAEYPNMDMSEPIRGRAEHMLPSKDDADLLALGNHIDHSKLPYQKPEVKMSTMSKEEKAKQFNTYFHVPTAQDKMIESIASRKQLLGKWVPYMLMKDFREFREDVPERYGKFGRRVFDPFVKEKPLEHFVTENEAEPMEGFWRKQEQLGEFLERQVPKGQTRHFQTSMPTDQKPEWYQEMASRNMIKAVVQRDGEIIRSDVELQTRETDPQFQRYTRPKNASQIDKVVPLAGFNGPLAKPYIRPLASTA